MAAIAKGIGFGGGNAKGIALFILVLLFAIGLFFIPEIIDFQRGLKKAKNGLTEESAAVISEESQSKKGLLESIKGLFRSPERKADFQESSRQSISRTEQRNESTGIRDKRGVKEKSALPGALKDGVTWNALKSKASMQALRTAEANALALTKVIPQKFVASRNALFVYASGLRFVLSGGEKSMDALQAFRFLEQLDSNVTETMLRERVAASEYNSWMRVSLGPVFQESRYVRSKQMRQAPFNPQLQLVAVQIAQPGTKTRKWIEGGPAYVHFAGLLVGRDINKVYLYRNGEFIASRVPRSANRFGQRLFKYTGGNARGVWTIKVVEKGGQTYEKSYVFYQRARAFPWLGRKKGVFAIPFNSFDPRIDALFTYSSGQRNKQFGSYFSHSVGDGFSTF